MKKIGIFLLVVLSSLALAHATFVFGTLSSEPKIPKANQAFTLTLKMEDPSKYPIEDAIVFAEFSQGKNDTPLSFKLDETKTPGIYQGQVTLPKAGKYYLLLRDRTYRQEDALANLSVILGEKQMFGKGTSSVIFPPTATGSYNLSTWIIWLIAVPVLAGIIVTIFVLGKSKKEKTS